MDTQPGKIWLGFVLAILGTLLFSLKSIFIKFLYQQGLDADRVLVFRMMLALPIYTAILFWSIRRKPASTPLNFSIIRPIFLLGFLGYFLASLLDLMGLEYITAQLERLSLFTYPFMVSMLGFLFFKQALSRNLVLSLFVTYTGLWIVMGQEVKLTGNDVIKGVLLVMASALSFSFYVLISKRYIKRLGSLIFTSIAMISSSIFGLVYGVFMLDSSSLELNMTARFWLFMLVLFSTVIPSFMMTEAIHRIGPAHTGIMGMLGPIFTIALAVYLLNEPFSVLTAVGGLLVMIGVITIMLDHK